MNANPVPFLRRTETRAQHGEARYAVARPVRGCTLNGDEYLCGKNGKPLLFFSVFDALYYLKTHGHTMDSIEAEGIKLIILECGHHAEKTAGMP